VGYSPQRGIDRRLRLGGNTVETTLEMLDSVEEELIARAFLFVDAVSYREGVEAATQAVRVMLTKSGPVDRKARS
jgi:hypothetical protein